MTRGGHASCPSEATTTRSSPKPSTWSRASSTLCRTQQFPFLGVHLTKRIDGGVLAGPNAVLATAREGYGRFDVSVRDLLGTPSPTPGFRKLARQFWRMGALEMWRDWYKGAFLADLRKFVPALSGDHLVFGPSGIRAQALLCGWFDGR